MGLFDRVERKLDRVINGAFARAFKAEVQPVEIASAMRRAMDERAAVVARGRTMVPNAFTIELDPTDFERLTMYEDVLVDELLAAVEEHAESQRYVTEGPLHVDFAKMDDLNTGVFRVRPRATADVPQRLRGAGQRRGRRGQDVRVAAPERHKPRNLPHPPEATAAADGVVGMAGSAASAAAGAVAGTAAAGRSGSYMARHESVEERDARERRDSDAHDDLPRKEREEHRRRDRAARGDEGAAEQPAGAESRAEHRDEPRDGRDAQRPPMRIYGDDRRDEGWDEPWQTEAPPSPASSAGGDADGEHYRRGDRFEATAEKPRDRQPEAPPSSPVEPDPTQRHPVVPPPLPDPANRPWLELDGDTYPLLAAITVLGRDSGADITLDDPGVSRRHAELRVTHDGPHLVVGLRDLGSTNGTYVNGERIASHRLGDGDRVTVGRVSFIVRTRRR